MISVWTWHTGPCAHWNPRSYMNVMLLHGSRALDEDDKNLRFSQRINL